MRREASVIRNGSIVEAARRTLRRADIAVRDGMIDAIIPPGAPAPATWSGRYTAAGYPASLVEHGWLAS